MNGAVAHRAWRAALTVELSATTHVLVHVGDPASPRAEESADSLLAELVNRGGLP